MRKNVALTGVVILLIGVALIGISFASGFSLPSTSKTVTNVSSGEWASGEINIASNHSLAVVTSASSNYGLVKYSELSGVTQANLNTFAIQPGHSIHVSSSLTLTYKDLNGSYYFVVFSSSTPTITVAVTNIAHAGAGVLLLPGGGLLLAGLIVMIVGLVLKRKPE